MTNPSTIHSLGGYERSQPVSVCSTSSSVAASAKLVASANLPDVQDGLNENVSVNVIEVVGVHAIVIAEGPSWAFARFS